MYQGAHVRLLALDNHCYHIQWHSAQGANILGAQAIGELSQLLMELRQLQPRGLMMSSAEQDFMLGADINEFIPLFSKSEETIYAQIMRTHAVFAQLENLDCPTVCMVNGLCLGGGLELALCCDMRLATSNAKFSFPETRLGILPGFGGTVRFSRLVGVDNAVEWIASAKEYSAKQALAVGAIDGLALQIGSESALAMLDDAIQGKLNWAQKRRQKQGPLTLAKHESLMAFETGKAMVAAQAGKHYPAPLASVICMQKHGALQLTPALAVEAREFAKIAKTSTAGYLIALFQADQYVKKISKELTNQQQDVQRLAVVGAGIMGGGIAAQAAKKGIISHLKDVQEHSLQLGLNEAANVFERAHSRGKMPLSTLTQALNRIRPTLNYSDFATAEVVIEAVVESPAIKKKVFAELSQVLSADAIIASNTSSIPISTLVSGVSRPENFAGLHFFNPVHRMPLVEVIRTPLTSDATVATLVKLARQMGKTALVVKDCPGFFVNRVLFPYFAGFFSLLALGQDFRHIDAVMTDFGWPMGPAHLLDVVGLDTAYHASDVMAAAFPDRMLGAQSTLLHTLYQAGMRGQKNQQGFYCYQEDAKGRLQPIENAQAVALLYPNGGAAVMSHEDIVARMMIPMAFETLRCLQEGIVASAQEADLALVYGLGFPPFHGGICHWMDRHGLAKLVSLAQRFQADSLIYQVPDQWQSLPIFYPALGGKR